MPTLDDLRSAFDQLADQAPAELAEPVRPTHRRRTAVLLAAACTAAVAVGVPVALHHDTGTSGPAAPVQSTVHRHALPEIFPRPAFIQALPAPADGESPDLAYGFTFDGPTAGYTIDRDAITRTYQHASLYGPTDPPGGQLWVFYRGAFDPSALADRAAMDVDGHSGYTGTYAFPNGEGPAPVLAWEYAQDGWAVLFLGVLGADGKPVPEAVTTNTTGAAEEAARQARIRRMELLIAIAMVASDGPNDRVLVPVEVSGSVATQVDSVSRSTTSGAIEVYDARAGRPWLLKWSTGAISPTTDAVEIDGHRWDLHPSADGPASALLINPDFGLTITTPSPATAAQLEQFVRGITLANALPKSGSWFDANEALP